MRCAAHCAHVVRSGHLACEYSVASDFKLKNIEITDKYYYREKTLNGNKYFNDNANKLIGRKLITLFIYFLTISASFS